mmetsp:Transcript_6214/g.25125  ORF Transcript_6214/g.25125 Transcript_6214/m.25125 type:complete len:674 (-) Transcript_6214:1823-3844(-)
MGRALGLGLLGGPDLFEVLVFALELLQFLLDQRKALLRALVLFLAHRFALDLELDHPAVQPVHRLGLGVDLDLDLGRGLVDQVDGLVGQEAVGDVAVAQLGRGDDGRVGDLHAVVHLVLLLQAAQDGNRGLHAGLVDQHLLEAALERGVLLDVFAVLVQGGGADAVQLAAGQGRLEHIAGVDGAFGLAGADHGVDLVDEQDGLAFVLGHFLEHALQALLEVAAVLRTGQQQRHVQHQHALVLQGIGHLAVDDALGQALDDGRLADARLADQHRVVLAAALQHLDGAADFLVAADDRVQLALASAVGQVQRVLLERLALALGFGVVDLLAAAHRLDRGLQCLARQAMAAHDAGQVGLGIGQGQQEHLAGDELVAALAGFLFGGLQQRHQVPPGLHRLARTADLGQAGDQSVERRLQRRRLDACPLQQRARAVVLGQHRRQHMDRLDIGVVAGDGQALGLAQGFLEAGGELVGTHGMKSPVAPPVGRPSALFKLTQIKAATIRMPNQAASSEPTTWARVWASAMPNCPCLSSTSDSPENAENVVKPPRNPVTSSSFMSSFGCRPNHSSAMPISRPPTRLTSRVPSGNPAQRALNSRPACQRARAPSAAPIETASAFMRHWPRQRPSAPAPRHLRRGRRPSARRPACIPSSRTAPGFSNSPSGTRRPGRPARGGRW